MHFQHSFRFLSTLFLSLSVFPSGILSAACNKDDCLRAFLNSGGLTANSQFCSSFLAATHTATTSELGPFSTQCKNEPSRVSSACSCIMTTTSSSTSKTSSATPLVSTSASCTAAATITSTVYPSTCLTTGFPSTDCSSIAVRTTTISSPVSTLTITSVSISTATVTVTSSPQPTCSQLVQNGGFETGSLTDWTDQMDNPGRSLIIAASSAIPGGAHSGSFAAAFNGTGTGPTDEPTGFLQTITIPSTCSTTQEYVFNMFVKTAFNICTVNIFIAGNNTAIIALALPPGGADPLWMEISGLVNVAPGTTSLGLVPTVACDTFDEIWFDDITLTPVPESA